MLWSELLAWKSMYMVKVWKATTMHMSLKLRSIHICLIHKLLKHANFSIRSTLRISVYLHKHSQKLTPYLFQNYVALHFNLYWELKNVADIWCSIMLKNWAFQWKKNKPFWLTWSKVGFNKGTRLRLTIACGSHTYPFGICTVEKRIRHKVQALEL